MIEFGNQSGALTDEDFDVFRQMIRHCAGIHLSDSKRALVSSRLAKRVRTLQMPSYSAYRDHLASLGGEHPEWQELINAITTNKTEFFREAHHFEFLRERLLPHIERQGNQNGRRIRIWSAGCSTGEEPYTIAMTLAEHFGSQRGWDIRILASDVDTEVLAHAANGVYNEQIIAPIPESMRRKYLTAGKGSEAGTYRVCDELRELVTFRRINFNDQPWPIHARFDFIFCRNVLIYFDREKQEQFLRGFVQKLGPNGHLFLGHSENVMGDLPELAPLGSTIYALHGAKNSNGPVPLAKVAATKQSLPRRIAAPQPSDVQPVIGSENRVLSTTTKDSLILVLHDPKSARTGVVQWPVTATGTQTTSLRRASMQRSVAKLMSDVCRSDAPQAGLVGKLVCADSSAASKADSQISDLVAVLEQIDVPCMVRRQSSRDGLHVSVHCGTGAVRMAAAGQSTEQPASRNAAHQKLELATSR